VKCWKCKKEIDEKGYKDIFVGVYCHTCYNTIIQPSKQYIPSSKGKIKPQTTSEVQ
jgi:hypothetical protein